MPVAWGLAHGDSLTVAAGGGHRAGAARLRARRAPARRADRDMYPDPRASVAWAAGSAVAFGTFLTALPAASEHGRAWALFDARLALLVIIVVWAGSELRGSAAASQRPPLLTVPGLLLLAGTLLYLFAAARGQLSLVSVLSSVAPVVTVGLERRGADERPTRAQTVGVARRARRRRADRGLGLGLAPCRRRSRASRRRRP